MKAYTYILRCADGSLYTGWTTDIDRRLKEHNGEAPGDKGAKCTHARRPCELVYQECFEEADAAEAKRAAMRREYAIKKLSRDKKLKLIGGQSDPPRDSEHR